MTDPVAGSEIPTPVDPKLVNLVNDESAVPSVADAIAAAFSRGSVGWIDEARAAIAAYRPHLTAEHAANTASLVQQNENLRDVITAQQTQIAALQALDTPTPKSAQAEATATIDAWGPRFHSVLSFELERPADALIAIEAWEQLVLQMATAKHTAAVPATEDPTPRAWLCGQSNEFGRCGRWNKAEATACPYCCDPGFLAARGLDKDGVPLAEDPAPREPRVWRKGDTIPADVRFVYGKRGQMSRQAAAQNRGPDGWWSPGTGVISEHRLLSEHGPVSEVPARGDR